MKNIQERLVDYYKMMDYTTSKTRSQKYIQMVSPSGYKVFLGKDGSLRTGISLRKSTVIPIHYQAGIYKRMRTWESHRKNCPNCGQLVQKSLFDKESGNCFYCIGVGRG